MKQLLKRYKHGWILGYFFIYCIWFFLLEKQDSTFHLIHCRMDDYIPMVEYFVVPYLLWFLYVAATVLVFFFHNADDFYHCTAFLFIGMTIGLLMFTFFPSEFNRGLPPASDTIFAKLVNMIHTIDSNTNVFPSIHVFNSIGCHVSIAKSQYFQTTRDTSPKKARWNAIIKWGSLLLCISICLSTMFIKQHSFLDLIAGMILAAIMYLVVYVIPWKRIFPRKTEK